VTLNVPDGKAECTTGTFRARSRTRTMLDENA